jgi:hypothetical protein
MSRSAKHIQKQLTSFFVHAAVMNAMVAILSSTASLSLSQTMAQIRKKEIEPCSGSVVAVPMMCVLSSLEYIFFKVPITGRKSFDDVKATIRQQCEVVQEFPVVEVEAMSFLEHALAYATKSGLEALEEALAGFPVSGADIAIWDAHQLSRHSS